MKIPESSLDCNDCKHKFQCYISRKRPVLAKVAIIATAPSCGSCIYYRENRNGGFCSANGKHLLKPTLPILVCAKYHRLKKKPPYYTPSFNSAWLCRYKLPKLCHNGMYPVPSKSSKDIYTAYLDRGLFHGFSNFTRQKIRMSDNKRISKTCSMCKYAGIHHIQKYWSIRRDIIFCTNHEGLCGVDGTCDKWELDLKFLRAYNKERDKWKK